MERIQIVYCGNDKVFDGLYLSILSILRRTKSPIDFYFLTGDLSEVSPNYISLSQKHIDSINSMIKQYGNNCTFTVVDCRNIYLKYKPLNEITISKWTPYTYFRLLIEDIDCLKGKVIYLDCDVLANGDITEMYNIDIGDNEVGVAHCCCQHKVHGKFTGKYFNAGSLLFNLDVVRKTHFLQKASQYAASNNLKYCDQDALNACWSKIMFLPNEKRFNYFDLFHSIKENTVLKHFLPNFVLIPWRFKVKPWQTKKVQKRLALHNWDEDFEIFRAEKNRLNEEWQ